MTDTGALQKLLSWMSPAFPVGAFAYSAGFETVIASGDVIRASQVRDWIAGSLAAGSAHIDAVLLAAAHGHATSLADLTDISGLCLALTGARERREELVMLGDSFVLAAAHWSKPMVEDLPAHCPYPVAVGAVAARHAIGLEEILLSFLTTVVQSQISVAVRLIPIGQSEGLDCLVALEPEIARRVPEIAATKLEDIGGAGYGSEIAAMNHERLHTRVFRS